MANVKAKNMVYKAVKSGAIPHISTQSCVDCGKQATDYDHRDYSKPLEVESTCRSCNVKRGKALCDRNNKNTTVTFQLPQLLKNKAVRKAKKEGMSFSYYMRSVIKNDLDNDNIYEPRSK